MIIFWREYCRQAWGLATVRIQEIYAKSSESVVLRGATVLAQSQRDCGVIKLEVWQIATIKRLRDILHCPKQSVIITKSLHRKITEPGMTGVPVKWKLDAGGSGGNGFLSALN